MGTDKPKYRTSPEDVLSKKFLDLFVEKKSDQWLLDSNASAMVEATDALDWLQKSDESLSHEVLELSPFATVPIFSNATSTQSSASISENNRLTLKAKEDGSGQASQYFSASDIFAAGKQNTHQGPLVRSRALTTSSIFRNNVSATNISDHAPMPTGMLRSKSSQLISPLKAAVSQTRIPLPRSITRNSSQSKL